MSAPLPSPVTKAFDGEARIILPVRDNDGKGLSQVAIDFRARLIDTFGGYTETAAFGGYAGTSQKTEMVRIFDIACDGGMETYSDLVGLASWVAGEARQECVYLRSVSGRVYLVAAP